MRTSDVSKCLDKKLVMLGFEVPDLLLLFLTMSVLNFLFNQTSMTLLLVWLPSLALAFVLRYGKRGKPEKYLIHWLRYQIRPGVLSAFAEPAKWEPPPRLRKVVR